MHERNESSWMLKVAKECSIYTYYINIKANYNFIQLLASPPKIDDTAEE